MRPWRIEQDIGGTHGYFTAQRRSKRDAANEITSTMMM
jgi:hypothetical protein